MYGGGAGGFTCDSLEVEAIRPSLFYDERHVMMVHVYLRVARETKQSDICGCGPGGVRKTLGGRVSC